MKECTHYGLNLFIKKFLKMVKLLFCEGDSWTAGDIVDPKLFGDKVEHVLHPDNLQYRLPRVWPHKLGKLLGIDTINNSVPGSSNDGIVRRVLKKINRLLEDYNSDEIFVIIGWTSPERKDFYCKKFDGWKTMYPAQLTQGQLNKELDEFYKLYLKYFWEEEEYTQRYMEQNLLLHYYLKNKNIKHYFFDAFYETKEKGMFHDESFNKFITEHHKEKIFRDMLTDKKDWDGYHPSEVGHTKWAEELYKDIKGML